MKEEKGKQSTYRKEDEKRRLIKRLKIINGQIRGVIQMVEEDRYCNDILIQVSAIDHALKSLGTEVLKSHMLTCVSKDVQDGNQEKMNEVLDLIKRFYV